MRSTSALALMMASLAVGTLSACGDKTDEGPTDAGTGGEATGKCPASAYICESFDNGQNGWKTPDEEHNATITIDSTRTRSGSGALHVVTEAGHNEFPLGEEEDPQTIAHLRKDIPTFGTALYARAYVYLNRAAPQDVMGTYFILFSPKEGSFGGIELQGMVNGGFALDDWSGVEGTGWNYQDDLKVTTSPNRWTCIEWAVKRTNATDTTGRAQVYVDGTLAFDFPNVGMRPFSNFAVGYGFVHPHGDSASETWIDDVAVAPERIGCE
ncbi:hypothetical protein D7Y13_14845 [Corallococcus praedator]|uniref:LamG domain-containing protein n=1 Tax=Corallococcus praedator TaxID=2316724 RepID=A0ABX9QJ53_9BACT|nr:MULTISPECIES: hypothetical protein [Corallococcus]RKH15793.1 hypothetical protein D7X74_17420 [Corallococcus sp. CA047B]RKH30099.1 hypothetical protein D7X75_21785 [Corallococcus sp. CA031C]RKI09106.1 hypothetical protein D7Y13_14845 [Corallococcus praedator]